MRLFIALSIVLSSLADAQDRYEIRIFVTDDGVPLGSSVLSDGLVLAGAPSDDQSAENSGSAYLFDAATGRQLSKLLPSDPSRRLYFGHAVALGQSIALITARPGNAFPGWVYIFDISDPERPQQLVKFQAPDTEDGDRFGGSLDVSGTIALFGAEGDDDKGAAAGAAYLFDLTDPSNPLLLHKLTASDGAVLDNFGFSVALDGTRAVVGAPGVDDFTGAAYLFDTATGEQLARLESNDDVGVPREFFGISVSISGSIAVVGSPRDLDERRTGAVYLFDADTGAQHIKLHPTDPQLFQSFGWGIEIDGTTMLVGAPNNDRRAPEAGAVFQFDVTEPGDPIETGILVASDASDGDRLGEEISMSRGLATVIGAGNVYLFQVSSPCPADIDADFDVDAEDFFAYLDAFAAGNTDVCDLDDDGDCDADDYLAYLDLFMSCI